MHKLIIRKFSNYCIKNKTVMITGATSGIGEACAWEFSKYANTEKLVLVGRKKDKLQYLKKNIEEKTNSRVSTAILDVRDQKECLNITKQLPNDFKNIDILINNAGIALGVDSIENNCLESAKKTLDTNVLGILNLCKSIIPGMIERNSGHVINIGSIAGHFPYANGSIYNASKFAVKGLTDAARMDLVETPLRVTHISPGMVSGTDFSITRFGGSNSYEAIKKAKQVYENIVPLKPEDIANNVVYVATRPPHCQITELTMMATNQTGPRTIDIARVGNKLGAK